jgi:general secretion pathway protein D
LAEGPRPRNKGIVHLVSLSALAAGGMLLAGGCNTTYLEQSKDEPQNTADIMRAADLRPRSPQPTATVDTGGASLPKAFSFFGSPAPPPNAPQPSGSQDVEAAAGEDVLAGGYTLNFENAPVSQVAKSVLGDVLGVGYVIDPRVQGSISLSSGRPVEKKDMLYVLESALSANNLVMVRNASGYRIAPANEGGVGAVDRARGSDGAEPGFGLTVIPLQYVSGTTLSKLLEGFATRPGAIRTDPSGKLLIVVGTGSERQSAIDTIRSFDVDWLRGQSVGMYPVQNSTPEPIVGELEKIMDSGDSGLGHGLVKFQPVSRLNSILVVASKPEMLRTAARWIYRLDEPSTSSASVKVYKVRYGDAKQIAQLLQQIFETNGGGVSAESPTNEIAPGSGIKAMAAANRLTGGLAGLSGGAGGASPNSPGGASPNSITPASSAEGGANPRTAAAQFGGVPVATLNSELGGLGQGGSGGPQLPNVRITADLLNNSVLIYARPDEYKLIERTLVQLDRPKLQVAIDVTIAEVTLNDQLNYGVQFFLSGGAISNTVSGTMPSIINNVASNTGSSTTGTGLSGGLNIIAGNPASPRVVINALSAITDVKILSNPSLVVVDNGDASLEVGDQVPISTGSANVLSANNAVVNTIDYKNTGVILHVQPHVNYNGSVLLDIDQLVSEPTGPSLTPTISTREVKSTISVVSGQTVLLAGMIQDQQTKSRGGVPILNQLPFVGAAFGTTGKSQARTELIMFIRPQIIRDGADAAMVAEELRAKMRGGRTQALTLPSMLNVLSRPAQ